MRNRLIIEGNAVYEIDEECMKKKQGQSTGRSSGPGQNPLSYQGQDKSNKTQRF